MKMKKVQLGFSILAASALLVLGCNKKDNIAPEPDTEFQSAVDVTWANMVITDIDQICAFVGENDLYPKFYMPAPNQSTIVVTRDTVAKYLFVSFNDTKCVDGRLRDGTIAMNYTYGNPNAKYYHDFEFVGNIQLINYKIDGWKIKQRNTFFVRNKVTPVNWDTKTTKLSWNLNGDFDLIHPKDSTKNIHINVDYTKTLLGTSNPSIFPVSKQAAINWTMASVSYKGSSFGETAGKTPFTFAFIDKEATPVIRDFTCYPDKVVGVSVGTSTGSPAPVVFPRYEEYHPFIGGAANFTTSTLYPRVIHYGSEQSDVANQCDDEGVITIKGISYPVNFVKENK